MTALMVLAAITACRQDDENDGKTPIASVAVTVSAPVKGRVPAVTAAVSNAYAAVSAVSWDGEPSVFQASTVYTVTVALTAKSGHTFANGLKAAVNNNEVTPVINANGTATLTHTFSPTLDKDVTGIAIKSAPAKLAYVHGEALDLSALEVTLTFNGSPQDTEDVALARFGDFNMITNPNNNEALSYSRHNGRTLAVLFPGLPAVSAGVLTIAIRYPSYDGLVMAGYQGWFNADGDGTGHGWRHYGFRDATPANNRICTIDFWPDMSEYARKYALPAKWFKMNDGSPAYVYSPYDEESVDLHFKWMKDYGIDGVFMQRFISEIKGARKNHFNKVLESALKAAKKYDRAIGVMYDLSGSSSEDLSNVLETDWAELQKLFQLNNLDANPTYIHHNGKPLLTIWGVGFNDNRRYTTADVQASVNRLKGSYSIMLGVPYWWRSLSGDTENNPALHTLIKGVDVIMPWGVGRYNNSTYGTGDHANVIPADIAWCAQNNVTYVPLAFPGFSWGNLQNNPSLYDQIPRLKGDFLWKQISRARMQGAASLYVAMFDEIDEGTAIFKCAVTGQGSGLNNLPVFSDASLGKRFVGIEADLDSDYYLWLTGQGARWFHGEAVYSAAKPAR